MKKCQYCSSLIGEFEKCNCQKEDNNSSDSLLETVTEIGIGLALGSLFDSDSSSSSSDSSSFDGFDGGSFGGGGSSSNW